MTTQWRCHPFVKSLQCSSQISSTLPNLTEGCSCKHLASLPKCFLGPQDHGQVCQGTPRIRSHQLIHLSVHALSTLPLRWDIPEVCFTPLPRDQGQGRGPGVLLICSNVDYVGFLPFSVSLHSLPGVSWIHQMNWLLALKSLFMSAYGVTKCKSPSLAGLPWDFF